MKATCKRAVPRAAALGWYVFEDSRAYAAFMAAIGSVYAYSIASCMCLRRIKDIPKTSLAKASPACF